jgi:hypothetical protein
VTAATEQARLAYAVKELSQSRNGLAGAVGPTRSGRASDTQNCPSVLCMTGLAAEGPAVTTGFFFRLR